MGEYDGVLAALMDLNVWTTDESATHSNVGSDLASENIANILNISL